jgi:hypothetical protein
MTILGIRQRRAQHAAVHGAEDDDDTQDHDQ